MLIQDCRSEPLKLRLCVEGELISFYREDTGKKLLIPSELAAPLNQEALARRRAEQQVDLAEAHLKKLKN